MFRHRFGLPIILKGILFLFALLMISGQVHAATINLCDLLWSAPSGGTVTLSSSDTYQISSQCNLPWSVTIVGNGVTINGEWPIVANGAGITLTVDNLVFNSSGWAALAAVNGGQVVVRNNSIISCPAGTALYGSNGSTVTVQSSSIPSAVYGVQITNASAASLHGLTVTNVPYAVMVSGVGSSLTLDGNSLLDYSGAGTGVALLDGAAGVVHDSTINGFTNGIDIHSTGATIYYGTVDVLNCKFDHNDSALAASYGANISFSTSTVTNSVTDGIYFNNSTAVVDKSQIIGSLNTGVSFIGCPSGTIQNSLVKDSVDQGVAVVANTPSSPPSLNIKVLNNTLVNSQNANLLVDNGSTAWIQGNIFTQTPDADIRFHGPKGITLDSALVIDSMSGMEINGSSTPNIVLSNISQNQKNGILVYDNSSLTAEHSFFWNNGLTTIGPPPASDSWSIFVNTGAQVRARYSTFGPAGKWGLDNASTTSCDVASNYWDAADGPNVASWILVGTNGSGARLESNYVPSGPATVTYTPFLTQTPVYSSVKRDAALPPGGNLTWDSQLGVTFGLVANPASPNLINEIVGVLKVNDTESLKSVAPPPSLIPGQIYVVWVSAPLRLNSGSGYLKFSLPSENGNIFLKRREFDGTWTSVPSTWDAASHVLTYSPQDVHLLNGTFAATLTQKKKVSLPWLLLLLGN